MYRLRPESVIIAAVSVIAALGILLIWAVSTKAPWSYIGPSLGPLIIALVAVIGTLYAANTGADAAIRAQRLTQDAIDMRKTREREERERRVKALFASHIQSLLAILDFQTQFGGIWEMDEFDRRLGPLLSLRDDKAIVLALQPDAISAVSAALVLIDLNIRAAKGEVLRQERRRNNATYGESMAQIDQNLRDNLKVLFHSSYEAFAAALAALGGTYTTSAGEKYVEGGPGPDSIYVDEIENSSQPQRDAEFEGLSDGPDIRPPEN